MSTRPGGPLQIGVDIGGSKIIGGVVDEYGEVLATEARVTPHRTTAPRVVEDVIVEVVSTLVARHEVTAVGIGAAGFVDATGQHVMFAPHLSWRNEPLAARLAARTDLPVTIDNDANAALWAEHRFGAGRDVDDLVMVTLGTGIGGAILVDGRPYRGRNGMAGEFGHMQMVPGGLPCECGETGCWEQYSSGKALGRFVHAASKTWEGAEITEAAEAGEPVAVGAYAEIGRWLGVGLANVVAALDPEMVIVGGGVSSAGDLLLGPARTAMGAALVGKGYRTEPRLVAAELGPLAGLVGAADLARESMEHGR